MATITTTLCDMTGESLPEDTPTTKIYIEDARQHVSVEIDLADVAFKGLLAGEAKFNLAKVLAKARPITLPQKGKAGADATEAATARAWALAHPDLLPEGVKASERGKVSNAVIEAYREFLSSGKQEETPENSE